MIQKLINWWKERYKPVITYYRIKKPKKDEILIFKFEPGYYSEKTKIKWAKHLSNCLDNIENKEYIIISSGDIKLRRK